MNVLSFDTRVRIAAALVEGCSQRAIARLVDVNRGTVATLALDLGRGPSPLVFSMS